MKKLFLWIAISALSVGCSDENESTREVSGEIVGQWKLTYVHARAWDSYMDDKSAKDIVYDFRANGVLVVSGDEVATHAKGEHSYSFQQETLSINGQNYESFTVKIGNQKWLCDFPDGEMRITEMDNDMSSLTFLRK